jgi:hypothetical protein
MNLVSDSRASRTNDVFCVRQNHVVLTPVAGAKSAVANSDPTGLSSRSQPPMTVTRRIRRRGEHGISRKAITQGMPDASAEPVCSCAHPLSIAHETAGAVRTRHSLRPLNFEGERYQDSGALRRETAEVCFCEAAAARRQSTLSDAAVCGIGEAP